jgi:hypothetical protein
MGCDTTTGLGKLMLSIMGGITDYADTAVMQSWAAEMQAWPGLLGPARRPRTGVVTLRAVRPQFLRNFIWISGPVSVDPKSTNWDQALGSHAVASVP